MSDEPEFKTRRGPKLPDLPENWKEMSKEQQKTWMIMHYMNCYREGEWYGLFDYAPEEVRKAYEELMKEDDYYVKI